MTSTEDKREILLRNGYAETREYRLGRGYEPVYYMFIYGRVLSNEGFSLEQAWEQLMEHWEQ